MAPARWTASDIADQSGRVAIVTGANSGLGLATARELGRVGARVVLGVRNTTKGDQAAATIRSQVPGAELEVRQLDLADLESVGEFATAVAAAHDRIDLLINNAGVMAAPRRLTKQGYESQFATNHLGHFALALGLHEALAAAGNARIVSLSSRGHLRSPVVFDDVNFTSRPYDPWLAYGQSKTANVLFAVEAARRWAGDGITANAVHPGAIETNLSRHMDPEDVEQLLTSGMYRYKTIEQGAATSVLVATSPLLEGVGGRYFEDCNEALTVDNVTETTPSGVAAYALDAANAKRLWELSGELLGIGRSAKVR